MLGQGFVEPWEGVTGGWWVHLGTSGAGLQPGHRSCALLCPAPAETSPSPFFGAYGSNLGGGWAGE